MLLVDFHVPIIFLGLRYIKPICIDASNAEERSEKDCYDVGLIPPSPKVYRCNTDPCPTKYVHLHNNFMLCSKYQRKKH